ncbi:MAG: carboxymuconolactone decarboxylase family protein [Thermoplasmata archaeon]
MTWIRTVGEEEAQGEVKEVYEAIKAAWGRLSPAFSIMSLSPGYLRAMWELHSTIMGKGRLSRVEKETIALSVSAINGCGYCIWAHSNRLRALGMDSGDVDQLMRDPSQATMEGRLGAIVRWAVRATKNAAGMSPEELEELRRRGLDDEAVLEVAAIVGHFNHLNRVLDALGVEAPSS